MCGRSREGGGKNKTILGSSNLTTAHYCVSEMKWYECEGHGISVLMRICVPCSLLC